MEVTILSTRICLCLDHALVFWESSMYVQVHTSLGLKIQVQVSPQIQLYLTLPTNHTGPISGQPLKSKLGLDQLEPAVMAFTLPLRSLWEQQQRHQGWLHHEQRDRRELGSVFRSVLDVGHLHGEHTGHLYQHRQGYCRNKKIYIRTPIKRLWEPLSVAAEIFAEEKCSILNDPNGMFAKCHHHIPTDHYHKVRSIVDPQLVLQSVFNLQINMGCRHYGTCFSRLASSGHVTVSGVWRSVFVLLWEAMPKPVLVWESSLVIGGGLLIAVSLDLTNIKLFFDLSWWCYGVMSDRLLTSFMKLLHLFCHSCKMWEQPSILLQHSSLQPHVSLPIRVRSSLWPGWYACWRLWLSRGNPPELTSHVYNKGRLLLQLLRWYNTTWSCRHWRSTVVS